MAKYDVTFNCGCTKTIELFGKSVDRDRKMEYLQTCECNECQAKKENAGCKIIEVKYSEYKNNADYTNLKQVPNSYDAKNKTIKLFKPEAKPENKIVENVYAIEASEEVGLLPKVSGTEDDLKKICKILDDRGKGIKFTYRQLDKQMYVEDITAKEFINKYNNLKK
jgi:uncharacterized protein YkuJ